MVRQAQPNFQYSKTSDGVSIAHGAIGEGQPFVILPDPIWSHATMEWQTPLFVSWYERLAKRRKVVRYDGRGTGLSTHDVEDVSLDARARDLEAVVDALDADRVVLFGEVTSAMFAVAYAVRHPERVSHLILWSPYPRTKEFFAGSQMKAIVRLLDTDWETFSEALARGRGSGWSDDEGEQLARMIRRYYTPDFVKHAMATYADFDMTTLLPKVAAPTLVLFRSGVRSPTLEQAKEVVELIPDARFVVLNGESSLPMVGAIDGTVRAIDEFLGLPPEDPRPADAPAGAMTILFTDIESSTSLTQRLGDALAQDLVRAHDAIVRSALTENGGSEVKHTGDGIMASFGVPSKALDAAIAIQREVTQRDDIPLGVRIGLNAGEPVAEGSDLFGTAVQLARRICDAAEAEQILVSDVVRQLAAGKGVRFADRGELALKGFDQPVEVAEVLWRGSTTA